jgi:hypothetical protein
VVDGSNIATEGRSLPSLAQLDQAVREFLAENPNDLVTVVVDASFGHRIETNELPVFEEAETAGEVVSPPAGAIGRGDAFLLRIAEKTGATVLSNDSFQEFHGEHEWLFNAGRLIGGKPVPGVGWIFTPRSPVRGPKSREAVKEAKRRQKAEGAAASGLEVAAERAKGKGKGKGKVDRAIARATVEAVEPKANKPRRRRRAGVPPSEPVNEPLAFITFIAAHPLGTTLTGTVESFSSHGAFVVADGARAYVPLSAMGDPPPRAAREVFSKGDEWEFVIQALDPYRRGIELALPEFAHIAGAPTEETVEAEISPEPERPFATEALGRGPAEKAPAKKGLAKKAPGKKAPLEKAPAKKAPAKKGLAKKAPGKKAPLEKAPAKKAPPKKGLAKKVPVKEAPAKRALPRTAAQKKTAAATKARATAGKKQPTKKAATAKQTGTNKNVPAKKKTPAKAGAVKKGTKKSPR